MTQGTDDMYKLMRACVIVASGERAGKWRILSILYTLQGDLEASL